VITSIFGPILHRLTTIHPEQTDDGQQLRQQNQTQLKVRLFQINPCKIEKNHLGDRHNTTFNSLWNKNAKSWYSKNADQTNKKITSDL